MHDSEHSIAFLGLPGAHSDMACRHAYPYLETVACASFEDILAKVEGGEVKYGLIPLENSQAGRVAEIHKLLPATPLHIVGEYFHRVENCLLGAQGAKIEDVKTVYSHPQALLQCRETLLKLGVETVPCSDTASAARDLGKAQDKSKAAIASRLAGELYGLMPLMENIEDSDTNTTVFVTFSREPIDPDPAKGAVLTSALITLRNIPAALYKSLGGFATNGVNLLKLESYIAPSARENAQFFLTFEGSPRERRVQLAMEELGFFCRKVRILGVYTADKARFSG
ncbi:MAG: prephenate dehydratase [Alphaproteobacteria bacterium]|nr:prephenate dehydratase [Alphaproteobacteria bacterium]